MNETKVPDANTADTAETTTWYDERVAALMPGTLLNNKYELIEQVGSGGMGVVWKAQDRVADRLVALKFVPSDLQRFDDEMKRMRESFKKVHALQHQSICPLYSLEDGEHLGYYLVMKYLEGETLDEYVFRKDPKREGLPPAQVVAILSRVAAALDCAHFSGVIHRDIKPQNIFLTKISGRIHVQVIDFGLADEIRTSLIRTSQTDGEVSGTRPYMSPEQWRGGVQTAATDQYALAVVAYELLSGRLPYKGSDVTMLRLAVMVDEPEPIPTLSETINDVLKKAMAKEPADRFPSCREFIAALSGTWSSVAEGETPIQEKELSVPFAMPEIPRQGWIVIAYFFVLLTIGAVVLGGLIATKLNNGGNNETVALNDDSIQPVTNNGASESSDKEPNRQPSVQPPAQPPVQPPVRQSEQPPVPPPVEPPVRQPVEPPVPPPVQPPLPPRVQPTRPPPHINDIWKAAGTDSLGWVQYYLDNPSYLNNKGARINTQRNDLVGMTPLHCAASVNTANIEMVRYLIARGADVNAKDHNGRTPLHDAAQFGSVAVLDYLCAVEGADVNAENNNGKTPRDLAHDDRNSKDHDDVLRKHGGRRGQ